MSFNVINFIPKIIFLTVVVLSIVFIVRGFVVIEVDVSATESYILINRFIYSPNLFIYYDAGLERNYPGTIDLDKFTDATASKLPNRGYIAAKLDLSYLDKKKSVHYNEDVFERFKYQAGISGGSQKFSSKNYVLVEDKGKFIPGTLEITVVVK